MLAFVEEEIQKNTLINSGNKAFMIPKRTPTVACRGSRTG